MYIGYSYQMASLSTRSRESEATTPRPPLGLQLGKYFDKVLRRYLHITRAAFTGGVNDNMLLLL